MSTNLRRFSLVVLALTGCSDAASPPEAPTGVVTPLAQWSGGALQLRVTGYATETPILVADGTDTLALSRLDDSTFALRVPDGPSGAVSLDLRFGRQTVPVGSVQRVGFRGGQSISPGFYGELITAHRGTTPVVVGASMTAGNDGPIQALDLGSMTVTAYPGLFAAEYYGISPTFRPDQFVVLDSARVPAIWQLWPTPVKIDTIGSRPPAVRQLARLSDSVWLSTSSHYSWTRRGSTTVIPALSLQTESPWAIFISPTGNLAISALAVGQPGVHVFNAQTGDTAYSLGAGFKNAQWAGFSPDGSTLFVLGGKTVTLGADSLVRLQAATGAVQAGVRVETGTNMAIDPVKPLIYVESRADTLPTILVLDAVTLTEVARLHAAPVPGFTGCNATCFEGALAVDRVRNQLHLVWVGSTSQVWSFDLVP